MCYMWVDGRVNIVFHQAGGACVVLNEDIFEQLKTLAAK